MTRQMEGIQDYILLKHTESIYEEIITGNMPNTHIYMDIHVIIHKGFIH